MNILVVGGGAREHCIVELLSKDSDVYVFMPRLNPGIKKIAKGYKVGNIEDVEEVVAYAKEIEHVISFAFIGQEQPLAAGVVDALENMSIPCIGPRKELAKLETSKSFTRDLLSRYHIDASPHYRIFNDTEGLKEYLIELGKFVIKPDGLTGGKGVKVWGEHLTSIDEAMKYASDVLAAHHRIIVEEKLEGEEFSLQTLTDGRWFLHFPPVQDHKRAYEDDTGPNTGGMGSYSDANFLLPFLTEEDIEEAKLITEQVAAALKKEAGAYRGIMYGGFIKTRKGVKLIEYNARFGDPEAMNVLPLISSSFSQLCEAVIKGELEKAEVAIESRATVVKYLAPEGYPDNPQTGKIEIPTLKDVHVYYASIEEKEDGIYTTSSRSIALMASGETIHDAERKVEHAAMKFGGKLFHRNDIGTNTLIQKRVKHMEDINEAPL